jgi:hypothetical protein
MKPFAIIYVIEKYYETRVVALGASLSEEAAERRLEEIKKNNPGKDRDYWVATYHLTDTFTDFDWI